MDSWVATYLSHFGLKRRPFQAEGDLASAWLANRNRSFYNRLKQGLGEQKGFVILVDEDGPASSALIDKLIQDPACHAVQFTVPDARLEILDFFKILAETFQFKKPIASKGSFFLQFRDHVQATCGSEGSMILILDEADRLGKDLLEGLCQLSDAKMNDRRLLSCLLIGHSQRLEEIFDSADPKISERVVDKIYLNTLNSQETEVYIRDCLKSAGAAGPIFDEAAEKEVFRFSRGKLWLIDAICELALICSLQIGRRSVDQQIASESVRHLGLSAKKDFDRAFFLRNAQDITEQIGLLAVAVVDQRKAAAAAKQTKARVQESKPPVQKPKKVSPRRNEDRYVIGDSRYTLGNAYATAPAGRKSGLPAAIQPKKRSPLLNIIYAMISLSLLFAMGYVWVLKYGGDGLPFGIDDLIVNKHQSSQGLEEIEMKASAKLPAELPKAPAAAPGGDSPEPAADMVIAEKISIYFKDKFNELQPDDLVVLQRLAEHLIGNPRKIVTLRGYSNTSGTYEHNLNVSRFQVNIVKTFLIAKGVSDNRIRALALGNTTYGTTDSDAEPFQSRKVVIEVSDAP
jgi:general secretion pathway protein A